VSFATESGKFRQELDAYCAAYPTDLSAVETEMHALSARHPEWAPFDRKAAGYRLITERCPVLARFLAVRGSVLQMNAVSPDQLREAKLHPERHPDLVVRVSAYSAYYTTLPAAVQDEILARTVTQT